MSVSMSLLTSNENITLMIYYWCINLNEVINFTTAMEKAATLQ